MLCVTFLPSLIQVFPFYLLPISHTHLTWIFCWKYICVTAVSYIFKRCAEAEYNQNGSKEAVFIAGWAHHWDGPQSPAIPVGLHPEYHQRGTFSHPHITQVQNLSLSIDLRDLPAKMVSKYYDSSPGTAYQLYLSMKLMGAVNIVIIIDWSWTSVERHCFRRDCQKHSG